MTINIRALTICITTSLLMTACASLKPNDGKKASHPPTHASKPVAQVYTPTRPTPATTQSVALPGDKALKKAQSHFHDEEYGLAEKYFRQADLENPRNLDALLGLAASYDHLKRFELASRAYHRAAQINQRSIDVLNNWGYSYLLRGNVKAARKKFLKAYEIDPENKAVNANLALLREGIKRNRRKRT